MNTVRGLVTKMVSGEITEVKDFDDHCRVLADALEEEAEELTRELHISLSHLRCADHAECWCSGVTILASELQIKDNSIY